MIAILRSHAAIALPYCVVASLCPNCMSDPPPSMTCPGDKLVWCNLPTLIYHFQGERYFGCTRTGKFLCQHDADREGCRPRHNGQQGLAQAMAQLRH